MESKPRRTCDDFIKNNNILSSIHNCPTLDLISEVPSYAHPNAHTKKSSKVSGTKEKFFPLSLSLRLLSFVLVIFFVVTISEISVCGSLREVVKIEISKPMYQQTINKLFH
jgi:hypothetical protein